MRHTIIHVAPFTGTGGIAYISNLIREEAGSSPPREAVAWAHLNCAANDGDAATLLRRTAFSLRTAWRLVGTIRRLRATGDTVTVHIHTSSFRAFYEKTAFATVARLAGSGVVLHLHGGAFDTFTQRGGRVRRFFIACLLRIPNRLLVLSTIWRDFMLRAIDEGLATRIVVLHNAVRVPEDSSMSTAETKSQDQGRGQPVQVVFLGRVGTSKGINELLVAAKEIGLRAKFSILGDAEQPGDLDRFKRRCRKTGLHNVRFQGHTIGAEKRRALENADVFVLPSHVENLPIAMLEAMSFGLPVIVTDVGAVHEVVGPDQGRLIPPKDPQALIRALTDMMDHPELRRKMGRRNAEIIRRDHNPGPYLRRIEQLHLNEVAGTVGESRSQG